MGKHVSIQIVRTLFVIAAGLLIPPLMNRYLGDQAYGSWQALIALMGLLHLVALGIPMASVKQISGYSATGDVAGLRRVLATCTGLYLMAGAAALCIGAVLIPVFDHLYGAEIARISPERRDEALWATGIVAINTALSFILRLPYGIMAAYQRFVPYNLMMMASTALRIVLIYAVLASSASFILLAIVEGLILLVDCALPLLYVWRTIPEARFGRGDFDRDVMRSILGYGGYVLLLQMGIRLSFMTDALVIGSTLAHENVAYYNSANTFLVYLAELMIALGQVVMPAASRLEARGRTAEAGPILLKWSRIALGISLLVCTYLLAFGPEFIGVWMHDPSYVDPARVVLPVLIASSLVFLPVRAVALPMLMGLGLVRGPTLLFLSAGALNLLISILLVRPLGLFGVALGTAIPNILFSAAMIRVATASVQIPAREWIRYVLVKPAIGGACVLSGLLLLGRMVRVDSVATVLATGAAATALFAAVWIFYVHRNDPHLDLHRMLRSRTGR